LKDCASESFQKYAAQVIANSKALCKEMMNRGYKVATGTTRQNHGKILLFFLNRVLLNHTDGTDTHVFLLDLRPLGLVGSKAEKVLEEISIAVNKNACPGDKSALNPGGVRIGTPALTSREFTEKHMEIVADFIDKGKNA
jgi:glycine hydroxymethyltransferase